MSEQPQRRPRVFIAAESFAWQASEEDAPIDVMKNVTRVREGHPLLAANPQYFRPVEDNVHYDIEQAGSGDPGEQRVAQIVEQPLEPKDATDAALARAAEAGVDLSSIVGSGPGGRVKKSDVEAAIAAKGQD